MVNRSPIKDVMVAILIVTLAFSVAAVANPFFFVRTATAESHEENPSEDSTNEDSTNEDSTNEEQHQETEQESVDEVLGENSKVDIELDENTAVEVEIQGGDLADGQYTITFNCTDPEFSVTFPHTLDVVAGEGQLEYNLTLEAATYSGCVLSTGGLSVAFQQFTIVVEHDDEEKADGTEEERTHKDAEAKSNEGARGEDEHEANDEHEESDSNDETAANTEDEQHNDDQRTIEDKQNERRHHLVEEIRTHEIHKRHIDAAKAHNSGDYQPGLPVTLSAAGTAVMAGGEAANAETVMDIAVWKSNRAIILMDVINGTITVGDDSYTIRLGYALYSLHHDVLCVRALVTDDATGEILKLRIQGDATIDGATFPMGEGEAMDLQFDGNHDRFANQIGSWELSLDGAVEA